VKQAHHFTLRPPETWRFGVNVLEKNTVQEPTPQKDKDVRRKEREDESLH
jgi:hypothetical protein